MIRKKHPRRCNSCDRFVRGKDKCDHNGLATDPLALVENQPKNACKYENTTRRLGCKTSVCEICNRNFTKGRNGGTAAKKRKTLPGRKVCARCIKKVMWQNKLGGQEFPRALSG